MQARRQESDWLRTAALAVWVRATIWGEQCPTVWELTGQAEPAAAVAQRVADDDAAWDAMWAGIKAVQGDE